MELSKPKIIAEIGGNHLGKIEIAQKMIETLSKFSGVDVVKFQKRNNKELLSEQEYNAPHPVPENAYGNTYGEHREYLEFDIDVHKTLKNICEINNLEYSCSVWDITSAKEIISLKTNIIKIPSAHNLDIPLLKEVCKNYSGEIHVSTGMTTEAELTEIINFFKLEKKIKQLVIYYCVSSYPATEDELCLYQIKKLISDYGNEIKGVGFSGHHKGIALDIAALTLGARYFERHFTLDRTFKGTDHAASLEPEGIRRLVRDINDVNKSLKIWNGELTDEEMIQRKKLKKIKH